jgi:hypothetical protein
VGLLQLAELRLSDVNPFLREAVEKTLNMLPEVRGYFA